MAMQGIAMAATVKHQGTAAMGCCKKAVMGFRDFILRGNVVGIAYQGMHVLSHDYILQRGASRAVLLCLQVDLAVAIVIGTAFTAVVKALVRHQRAGPHKAFH